MNFLNLSEDVLLEILKRLDTKSKLVLWDMCSNHAPDIRNLLRRPSVMQRVHLAGPYSVLERPALLDLAPYIVELDLSGLRTLKLLTVLKVIKQFTNLRELDLTHTRVGMMEACQLCEVCPNLKRLAIFFNWPDVLRLHMLSNNEQHMLNLVKHCQRAYRHLEDVRFLGECDMVQCTHPLEILKRNDCVRSLRLDLIEGMAMQQHFECSAGVPPSLRTFDIRYMDRTLQNDSLLIHRIVTFFDLNSWHYLLVERALTPIFHMSARLYAFSQQFLCNVQCDVIASPMQHKGSHLYMWHSDLEKYNPRLLQRITDRIRTRAPTLICDTNEHTDTVNILNKSFVVHVFSLPPVSGTRPDSPPADRHFNGERSYKLNLDSSLQMTRDARVSVVNENCRECSMSGDLRTRPVLQLDLSSATVRHLSFLSITDCWLDVSFKVLWEICRNLQTLKLINSGNCTPPTGFHNVMQTVHLSSSIKNLMYVDVNVDIKKLLISMAQCPTLENVFWGNMEDSSKFEEQPDYTDFSRLFSCCPNLRSLILNLHNLKNYKIPISNAVHRHKGDVLVVTQSKYPYHKMERNDPYFAVFEHFDADNIFDNMNFNFG